MTIENLSLQAGKLPPQAIDIEEVVLGACMVDKDAIVNVADKLKPHYFYKDCHRILYESIIKLYKDNKDIDMLTVIEQLKTDGNLEVVGSYDYITKLTSVVGNASHVEYHADIIIDKFMSREVIRVSAELSKDAFSDNGDKDLVSDGMSKFMNISNEISMNIVEPINIAVDEVLETAKLIRSGEKDIIGIPTGFDNFDRIIGGLIAPDLIILAARPGMGKTALAMTIAHNVGLVQKIPLAVFSLEMSKQQLVKRQQAIASQIDNEKLKNPKLMNDEEWELYLSYSNIIKDTPIFIDDQSSLNIIQLRTRALKLKKQHDIQLIIVDYLQLMIGVDKKGSNREGEVSEMSRGLKSLAKELNIPIIALAQLNRKVEDRKDNKPRLSDLRESGAIEQDADSVWFINRPCMYDDNEDEAHAEILISKHRDGATGITPLKFIANTMTFLSSKTNNNSGIPF